MDKINTPFLSVKVEKCIKIERNSVGKVVVWYINGYMAPACLHM